jgi:DNA (cytosine-5)-methyltransferase 1
MLTVGSLFSGIGGLDLGLERAGMKVIWQSEIDPYCNKVLKKHWPEVPNYGNIKEIEWATIPRPDVICGGYPCQPFSTAGKRRGTDDPRHLWPWVRTAISELQPRYAILENVRGHLSMGGLQVIGELAEIGYNSEWRIVSAAGLGAPHRRDRLIIVAYPNDTRGRTPERGINIVGSQEVQERQNVSQFGVSGHGTHLADTASEGLERAIGQVVKGHGNRFTNGRAEMADTDSKQLGQRGQSQHVGQTRAVWQHNGTGQAGYDGWQWWQVEPDVGRVANGVSARVDRLRGLGNAVVPQVAEYIGRLVMAAELNNS